MDNYLCLEIPEFQVKYSKHKKYGYEKSEERENLKDILNKASKEYCMYCYSRLKVDNKWYGNLEHAIEKSNSDKLIECIPNIGMSCSICNQTFKRIGERKRKVSQSAKDEFEKSSRCTTKNRKQCTVPCKALRNLQVSYSGMEDAEILLQPMGIERKDSNELLALQYDVLRMEFLPCTILHNYSEEELLFINRHIKRFHLNDPKYRTHALIDFVKNVIDNGGKIPDYEYNNLVVQLFVDKIKEKTQEERFDICCKIYPIMFLKA